MRKLKSKNEESKESPLSHKKETVMKTTLTTNIE